MDEPAIFFEGLCERFVLLRLASRVSHHRWRGDYGVINFDRIELDQHEVCGYLVLFYDLGLILLHIVLAYRLSCPWDCRLVVELQAIRVLAPDLQDLCIIALRSTSLHNFCLAQEPDLLVCKVQGPVKLNKLLLLLVCLSYHF